MNRTLLTLTVLFVAAEGNALAQSADSVIDTWQLISASSTTADGTTNATPFGVNPGGVLVYTAEGRMTVMISYGGRKPLSADRTSSPASERADAYATFFAYAGRYSLREGKVVHHVEISSVPNWVGMDLVRDIAFEGGRLKLRTPPIAGRAGTQTAELVWQRAP